MKKKYLVIFLFLNIFLIFFSIAFLRHVMNGKEYFVVQFFLSELITVMLYLKLRKSQLYILFNTLHFVFWIISVPAIFYGSIYYAINKLMVD